MTADGDADFLLAQVLRSPAIVRHLSELEWDGLIRHLRLTRLHGRVASDPATQGLDGQIPARAHSFLTAARLVAEANARSMRWELNRIGRTLSRMSRDVVLLKGAAYLAAGLPPARGRLAGDVDILVRRESLASVEAALLSDGWQHVTLDPYDQRYYRQWMHELPPLRHRHRGSVIDVHHTLLPTSGRIRIPQESVIQRLRPLPNSCFKVLSPPLMVLHSIAHWVQDGDLLLALRDVVDIHDLLVHFSQESGFWSSLLSQARDVGLLRPLYYGIRYSRWLMGTPIPVPFTADLEAATPPAPIRALMDWVVPRALLPTYPQPPSTADHLARSLLYLRSHWLRMPPLLLATHLARKSWFRTFGEERNRQPRRA